MENQKKVLKLILRVLASLIEDYLVISNDNQHQLQSQQQSQYQKLYNFNLIQGVSRCFRMLLASSW